MVNKKNASYVVAGILATFTLLASGVFAVAPYVGFLAPIAALSVGLPFIIGCAIFSAVIIALSYKAIFFFFFFFFYLLDLVKIHPYILRIYYVFGFTF